MSDFKSHVVNPQRGHQHTHTVILLHPQNLCAEQFCIDFFGLVSSRGEPLTYHFPSIRWVFPEAREIWCTSTKRRTLAWFDMYLKDGVVAREDLQVEGLREGIHVVEETIANEVERLQGKSEHVFLGGFSMGGAMALWSMFTGAAFSSRRLGGFIGQSAFLPFTAEAQIAATVNILNTSVLERIGRLTKAFLDILGLPTFVDNETIRDCVHKMPVFLGHGDDDTIVTPKFCTFLTTIFIMLGFDVRPCTYTHVGRNGHWLAEPEEVDDIKNFLLRLIPNGST